MMISAKLRGFTGPPAGRATEIRALVEGRARTERLSAIHAEYMRRSGAPNADLAPSHITKRTINMNTAMPSPGRALARKVAATIAGARPEDLADPEIQELARLATSTLQEETTAASREAMLARLPASSASLFNKWVRKGDKALSAEDWAHIRATMSTTTGSEGGFSTPIDIANDIVDALKLASPMIAACTVETTDNGRNVSLPLSDGTAEIGERKVQNVSATGADIVFGSALWNCATYDSKYVVAPLELVEDTGYDLFGAFLNQRFADRIGRAANVDFTTGVGSATVPQGVVGVATAGKVGTAGQGTLPILDDIIDTVHALDPLYRNRPGAAFMMHDTMLKSIRKLKDTAGAALIQTGQFDDAAPHGRIMGYPIFVNNDMATPALNSKSLLFGNFFYYKIRRTPDVTLWRSDDSDSAYVKLGQRAFMASTRLGGNLTDVNAVKYFQCAAS